MRAMLAAILLLIMLVAPASLAQSEPPDRVRSGVEQDVAVIRVIDRSSNQAIRFGTGLVILDDGDRLTLATAAHVVGSAARDRNQSVEVRFRGQDLWVSATGTRSLEDSGLDLAVIEVGRGHSPFGQLRRGTSLPLVPPPGDGTRAWAYGYDADSDQPTWRACWVSRQEGSQVRFDGGGIAPGCSGGVVVSTIGLVAMITDQGPGNSSHLSTSFSVVADALTAAGVNHTLIRNSATIALRHASETGLAVAFCFQNHRSTRDGEYQFWAAARLSERADGSFAGTLVNGEDRHRIPEPNEVRLSCGPMAVSAEFSVPVQWDYYEYGVLETSRLQFELCGDLVVDGMEVLRAEAGDYSCYMAIPTGSKELLLARAMLGAVPLGGHLAELPPGIAHRYWLDIRKDGRSVPFSSLVSDEGDRSARLEFRLPPNLVRDEPITIQGRHIVPDILNREERQRPLLAAVEGIRVRVETMGNDVLQECNLGPDNHEFTLRLASPPEQTLNLRLFSPRAVLDYGAYTTLWAVTVDYESLK